MKKTKYSCLALIALCILSIFNSSIYAQVLNAEQTNRIKNAKQGSILNLDDFLSKNKFAELNYQKVVLPGPQFIISDDPEYIRVPEAVALREAVQPGAVRLYVYNVNGVKEPSKIARKITAVIKNTGTGVMHLRMLKYASQKPSGNYFQIGKQGLADYFASVPESKTRSVKPGEAISIDEKLEKNSVNYDELVHGFYEFVIDEPGEISVIQTDTKTPGPVALKQIKTVLPTCHNYAGIGLFGISYYQVITVG
ncbi:MAG: copper amine oxidase, partial [Daejeonella sp.]|nr:copper amine oxidase [Daejeonella sp.]